MSIPARFEATADSGDRRDSHRRTLRLTTTAASVAEFPEQAATIHDLSESGLLLETPATLTPGQAFQVILPLAGPVDSVVVWNSGQFYGCQFAQTVPRAAISAALLKSAPELGDEAAAEPAPDLLSQLRDLNERIEQVGRDLDRTIAEFAKGRSAARDGDPDARLTAGLPHSRMLPRPPAEESPEAEPEPERHPGAGPENDAVKLVWLVSLILAGLAVLILIAALLGLPLG